MLRDALAAFRRPFAGSLTPTGGRRRRGAPPGLAAERLEDRTLLTKLSFFQKHQGVDWKAGGAGGVGGYVAPTPAAPEYTGRAVIPIDGVSGTVVAGYLYWQGIDRIDAGGDGVYDNATVTFAGTQVTGVSVGTGGTANWGGGGAQAFRADVTSLLGTGDQDYVVTGLAAMLGHNANGVSLVVVYQDGVTANDRDLYLLDGNHTVGTADGDGYWSAVLTGMDYHVGDVRAQLHVADGQDWADPSLRFSTRAGANYPMTVADAAGLFDGTSVRDEGRSRASNGSLWDIHTLDVTQAFANPFSGPGPQDLVMSQSGTVADSLTLVALLYDTAASREGNLPPTADARSVYASEDANVSGTLTGGDPNGDPISFQLVTGPTRGRLTLSSTGSFVYTPNANYNGPDSFTFRTYDGLAYSEAAAVSITVAAVNDPPVGFFESRILLEDGTVSGFVFGRDVDGDPVTFELVSGPTHGALTLNPDGSYLYAPAANYNGGDSFVFRVSDGQAYSQPVTQPFTVSAVNDPPALAGRTLTTGEDTPLRFFFGGTDVEGDAITYVIDTPPTRGTLSLNGDGSYTYRPAANASGVDSFTVRAYDGKAYSAPATFTVEVTPVNDAPFFPAQSFSTPEDTALAGRVTATDADGDPLVYELVEGPRHGTLSFGADGRFTYTPKRDYDLSDSFRVRAYDGQAWSFATLVSVDITPVNDPPVAAPDAYTVAEDGSLSVPAVFTPDFSGTMTSDPGDPIGGGLTYDLSDETGRVSAYFSLSRNYVGLHWQNPANLSDYWTFDFSAPPGEELKVGTYTGAVRHPFNDAGQPGLSVTGQHRGSNTLTGGFTVSNLVWAADGSVAAFDVSFEQHSNGIVPALRGTLHYVAGRGGPGVLGNDHDVDRNPITARLVAGPAHGSLTLNADGSFSYTPEANFHGTDAFTYSATDGVAASEPVTVTITVTPAADPPVATGGAFAADEDSILEGRVTGEDPDGDVLTYVLEQLPAHGTLTFDPDGTFRYAPNENYHSPDSFTYRASDGSSLSAAAAVSLIVRPVNDPPSAAGGSFAVTDNSSVGTAVGTVAASDPDGDDLAFRIASGDPAGYFAVDAAGRVTVAKAGIDYRAMPRFTLTVEVSDGNGGAATATVLIEVRPLSVSIDVDPGDATNTLDPKRDKTFSVAILSTATFDARLIDVGSLTFGATGDERSLAVDKRGRYSYSLRDVNGDGRLDLVVEFDLAKSALPPGLSTATLKGRLLDGTDFTAEDQVRVAAGSRGR